MAATLKTLSTIAQTRSLFDLTARCGKLFGYGVTRSSHILRKDDPEEKIVITDNGATIVCWHPEPKFPYECSLPLPTVTNDVHKVLKAQSSDVTKIFHFEKPQQQREYLQKVTATTKHRWFPRLGIKYAKKTKPDREYL